MYETLKGNASFWAPYLRTLPAPPPLPYLHFEDESLSLLAFHPGLRARAARRAQRVSGACNNNKSRNWTISSVHV
jgi:hypothetical protein